MSSSSSASLHAEHDGFCSSISVYSPNFSLLFSPVTFWKQSPSSCLWEGGTPTQRGHGILLLWCNWWYIGRSPKGHLLPLNSTFLFYFLKAYTLPGFLPETNPTTSDSESTDNWKWALNVVGQKGKGNCYSVVSLVSLLFVDLKLAWDAVEGD